MPNQRYGIAFPFVDSQEGFFLGLNKLAGSEIKSNLIHLVLTQKGYTYDFINLQELGKTAEEVTGRPVKTVPQIYIEGQYVGGFQEMMEYFNNQIVEDDECTACEG